MIFQGTAVAMVTPTDVNGINFAQTQKLLDYIKDVDALVALGTTGEAATLEEKQKWDFVSFVRKKSSLPLLVGTGSNDTKTAARLSKCAQDCGADALLIVTPFYNKCTQEGAYRHYEYISERINIPFIVYNVPARTGFDLHPDTVKRISLLPHFGGIKEASGNMGHITDCLENNITVYSGDDGLIAPAMCLGAKGVISVAANVAPNLIRKLTDHALKGDMITAGKIQLKLNGLIKALFSEVNPIPVRAALELLDIDAGSPRLPLTRLTSENLAILKKQMEELNLI